MGMNSFKLPTCFKRTHGPMRNHTVTKLLYGPLWYDFTEAWPDCYKIEYTENKSKTLFMK